MLGRRRQPLSDLPAPEVEARYRARGICVLRTDRCGAVTVVTDGRRLDVTTLRPGCGCLPAVLAWADAGASALRIGGGAGCGVAAVRAHDRKLGRIGRGGSSRQRALDVRRQRRGLPALPLVVAVAELGHHVGGEQLERLADVVVAVVPALLDEDDLVDAGLLELAQVVRTSSGRADAAALGRRPASAISLALRSRPRCLVRPGLVVAEQIVVARGAKPKNWKPSRPRRARLARASRWQEKPVTIAMFGFTALCRSACTRARTSRSSPSTQCFASLGVDEREGERAEAELRGEVDRRRGSSTPATSAGAASAPASARRCGTASRSTRPCEAGVRVHREHVARTCSTASRHIAASRPGRCRSPRAPAREADSPVPNSTRPFEIEVERRDALRDARRMVVAAAASSTMPCPRRIRFVRCGAGGEEHLGRRGVRVLLEEVVLDLPGVVDARAGRRARPARAPRWTSCARSPSLPRPRQLVLVEDPELHAGDATRVARDRSSCGGEVVPQGVHHEARRGRARRASGRCWSGGSSPCAR